MARPRRPRSPSFTRLPFLSPVRPPPLPPSVPSSADESRFVSRARDVSPESHEDDEDDVGVGSEGRSLRASCPKIIAGLVIYSVRASPRVVLHVTLLVSDGKKTLSGEARGDEREKNKK